MEISEVFGACEVCGGKPDDGVTLIGDPGSWTRPYWACNNCYSHFLTLKKQIEKSGGPIAANNSMRKAILERSEQYRSTLAISNKAIELTEGGNHRDAFDKFNQAMKSFREMGEFWDCQAALSRMAWACRELGKYEMALKIHAAEEQICRQENFEADLGDSLCKQGQLHWKMGNSVKARDLLQESVKILEKTGKYEETLQVAKDLLAKIR